MEIKIGDRFEFEYEGTKTLVVTNVGDKDVEVCTSNKEREVMTRAEAAFAIRTDCWKPLPNAKDAWEGKRFHGNVTEADYVVTSVNERSVKFHRASDGQEHLKTLTAFARSFTSGMRVWLDDAPAIDVSVSVGDRFSFVGSTDNKPRVIIVTKTTDRDVVWRSGFYGGEMNVDTISYVEDSIRSKHWTRLPNAREALTGKVFRSTHPGVETDFHVVSVVDSTVRFTQDGSGGWVEESLDMFVHAFVTQKRRWVDLPAATTKFEQAVARTERPSAREEMARDRIDATDSVLDDVRKALGVPAGESIVMAARRIVQERDDLIATLERMRTDRIASSLPATLEVGIDLAIEED